MRRELTMRPTQINGGGYAQDIARECQQSPPQKRTRLPPRRSDSDRASNRGTNSSKSYRPRKGKDQAEREELSLTRSLREGTGSAPVAPGCQENRPSEAEATPEEGSKPKRQSADRGQSRYTEPGSRPTARGAQRRERYTRKEGTSGCRAQS